MDDGMQWLAGTILSAVISSVITVGFLSALVTRLQIRIDHRNNGIKRVYAPGEHSRTLKKQLAEARAIPASGHCPAMGSPMHTDAS